MKHFIGKQIISVVLRDKSTAFEWQHRLSRRFQDDVVPALERLFDRLAGEDQHLYLENLEIDLGVVSEADILSGDWVQIVIDQVEEALMQALKTGETRLDITARQMEQFDRWLYFLQYGELPRFAAPPGIDWPETILQTLGMQAGAANRLQDLLTHSPQARERLILQYPAEFLVHVLELLTGNSQKELTAVLDEITTIWEKTESRRWSGPELEQLALTLQILFPEQIPQGRPLNLKTLKTWLKNARQRNAREIEIRFWRNILRTRFAGARRAAPKDYLMILFRDEPAFRAMLPVLQTLSSPARTSGGLLNGLIQDLTQPAEKARANTTKPAGKKTGKLQAPENKPAGGAQMPESKSGSENQSATSTERATPGRLPRNPAEKTVQSDPETQHKPPASPMEQARIPVLPEPRPAEEGWHTDMAGVVILHPFLPHFFKNRELINPGGQDFRDEWCRQKAVHLLHYLVHGRLNPAEHQLALAKLLCGVAAGQPVDCVSMLEPADKTEADALLEAVVGHWPVLGKTSPDGLREGFLIRDGKLSRAAAGWRLEVERKTIDILLEKLDWSLGVVKTPWMNEMLFVDWAK